MSYVQPDYTLMNPDAPGSYMHYIQSPPHPPHPSSPFDHSYLPHPPHPPYPLHPSYPPHPSDPHDSLAGGGREVRVPRPQGITPSFAIQHVAFGINDRRGVRLKDILNNVDIHGSTDFIFANSGWRTTVLALEWPGYTPHVYQDKSRRRINVSNDGRLMTRQEFAREIACHIVDFCKEIKGKPVAHGFEQWAFGENVRLSKVVILSAHYYIDGYKWVPELSIIE